MPYFLLFLTLPNQKESNWSGKNVLCTGDTSGCVSGDTVGLIGNIVAQWSRPLAQWSGCWHISQDRGTVDGTDETMGQIVNLVGWNNVHKVRCTDGIKCWTFEQRPVCTEGTASYVFGTIYVRD